MTDREPDDLYDALRDRLADYGQEPPAPLWAGIRAQLPPPVAQPQLRPRRRRASMVLLLLLLITASGLSWHWWHSQPLNGSATASTQLIKASKSAETAYQKSKTTPDSETEAAPQHVSPGEQPQQDAAPQTIAVVPPSLPSNSAATAINKATSTVIDAALTTSATGAKQGRIAKPSVLLAPVQSSRQPREQRLNSRTNTLSAAIAADRANGRAAHRFARHSAQGEVAGGVAIARNPPAKTITSPWAAKNTVAAHPTARQAASSALVISEPTVAPTIALNQPSSAFPVAGVGTAEPENQAPQIVADQAVAATNDASARTLAAAQQAARGADTPGALAAEALARLQAHAVALRLVPVSELGLAQPQTTTTVPNKPSATPLPRWAVQVSAGPALTYRQLSSAALAYAITPGTTNPIQYQYTQTNVAELERPALGSGAQISMRRALTERWNLSAGLGYAEYATRLALQQVRTTATANNALPSITPRQDSSSTSIHRRDTYRFVTVPLRVGYAWPLSSRWSVGLLAGFDAAFYVGGTTTEGSACACQTQTWGGAGSPYRRVSVGASLGAEVRYRLTGRWELLAQPTGTYMLNPLAQAPSAYYKRQLLGGTALLGASYTLP